MEFGRGARAQDGVQDGRARRRGNWYHPPGSGWPSDVAAEYIRAGIWDSVGAYSSLSFVFGSGFGSRSGLSRFATQLLSSLLSYLLGAISYANVDAGQAHCAPLHKHLNTLVASPRWLLPAARSHPLRSGPLTPNAALEIRCPCNLCTPPSCCLVLRSPPSPPISHTSTLPLLRSAPTVLALAYVLHKPLPVHGRLYKRKTSRATLAETRQMKKRWTTYPNVEFDILVRDCLDVESDGGNGRYGLVQFEFVQDCWICQYARYAFFWWGVGQGKVP